MTPQRERRLTSTSRKHNHPPLTVEKGEKSGEKKKRKGIKAIGVVALTGVLTFGGIEGSKWIENANYDREAVVRAVDIDHTPSRYEDSVTLTVTGYNTSRQQTRMSAENIKPALGEIGGVGWIGHSDRGVSAEAMASEVEVYLEENNLDVPNFYGSSMGGLVTLEMAALLTEKGVVPEFIILDSTPATYANLRSPRTVEMINTLNTPAVKNAFAATQSVVESQRNPLEATGDFIHETLFSKDDPDKTTSRQTRAQIDYIREFDIDTIAKRISPETTIIYIGGGDRDTVVDTVASHRRITEAFPDRNITYYDTDAPHASPIGDSKQYLRTLTTATQPFRTPPGNSSGGIARLLN